MWIICVFTMCLRMPLPRVSVAFPDSSMFVTKEFTFDSAHFLTRYHGKCEHMHGHTYRLCVTVEGEMQENGMVVDFSILNKIVKEQVLQKYDHRLLNDFFENPTAECVAQAIWDALHDLSALLRAEANDPNLPDDIRHALQGDDAQKEVPSALRLYEISLWETPTSYVTLRAHA